MGKCLNCKSGLTGNYLADFSTEKYKRMVVNQTNNQYYVASSLTADYKQNVMDKNGAVVYDAGTGADWTLLSNPIALTKGDYTVVFEYRCTDGVEVNEEFACRVTLTR